MSFVDGPVLCAILAHGFARAYRSACGHDFLIAFSCKSRDICTSCAARRMVETAAHLTDQVLPRVRRREPGSAPWPSSIASAATSTATSIWTYSHVLLTDGVFSAEGAGRTEFPPATGLDTNDVAAVQAKVRRPPRRGGRRSARTAARTAGTEPTGQHRLTDPRVPPRPRETDRFA
jgi:hypothetical protein